jgi:nicotinate-nucleotide pyrophosphorylase (carboxylating)
MIGTRHPPPSAAEIISAVDRALEEDIGSGDLTADLIPETETAHARVITREAGVLAGAAWFEQVFARLDSRVEYRWHHRDGEQLRPDAIICQLTGPARALLSGERTALNFLQTLSGTATTTRSLVETIPGCNAKLLDTRKTLPGLRSAQKYAVACGGGYNHRMGLFDAMLVKENHITAAGSISAAIAAGRRAHPGIFLEVEVETLSGLDEAIAAGADCVLLDNFTISDLDTAVRRAAGRLKLEASGGITPATLPAIAATGVDFISLGTLTKHVRALDLSMRFVAD